MKQNKTLFICLLSSFMLLALNVISQDIPLNFEVENTGSDCGAVAGALQYSKTLPDPFQLNSGGRVSTLDEWKCRRNEIKKELEKYEIGAKPEPPQNITATYSGGRLTVKVTENGQTLTLNASVKMPSGNGPHPVMIGVSTNATGGLDPSLFSRCIQIFYNHDDVLSYSMGSGSRFPDDPFYRLFPDLAQSGKYCGWSWGLSRIIDGIEMVQDQLNADMGRIAISGCSYAGKLALFSGAFDERVTLTIVQESGGGGINSWRLSADWASKNQNVEKIDNTNYSWFMQSMRNLDPYELPYDHHELIAMIAPRPVLILGNPDMVWLCDPSGQASVNAAMEVWKAMGVEDRIGYDFARGHNHCQASTSQNQSIATFVDRFLYGNQSANTLAVRKTPVTYYSLPDVIDWTTPEISVVSDAPELEIISPVSDDMFMVDEVVSISATAAAKVGTISKVEILVNDELIKEFTAGPFETTWSTSEKGTAAITVIAYDTEGNKSSRKINVPIRVPQGPYGGTPHAVPGKIEFENYDVGGQEMAYFDSSPGTEVDPAPDYRTDEDVDLEVCEDTGGGYNLGWTDAGEWTEYTVNVKGAGTYDVSIRAACNGDDRTVSLEANGKVIASNIAIPNTAGWQEWETVTIQDVELEAGEQVIRLIIGDVDYVNLNYMEFVADDIVVPEKIKVPLSTGWNMIGCPLKGSTKLAEALSSIWEKVEVVKDFDGFWDAANEPALNSLENVIWGKGYFVKVNADCELTW